MGRYRTLLAYAFRQRGLFAAILVLTVISATLVAVQPWPMKLLVDNVLGQKPIPDWLVAQVPAINTPAALLFTVVAGGLILFIFNAALDAALTWSWTVAGRRMVYQIAADVFARLQERSIIYHSKNAVGDTMSRITVDCWAVHKMVDLLFFAPTHALLSIILVITLMLSLHSGLMFIALLTAPLMVGASMFMGKPLRAAAKRKREIESQIQSHIQQTLTGIPVVQAFAQEEREQARLQSFADSAIRVQQRSTLIGSVNSLTSGLITTAGSAVILWVGAHEVLSGRLTLGSLIVFLVYLNTLQAHFKTFAGIYTGLQGLSASRDRLLEALESQPEIVEKPDALPLTRVTGRVSFEHVGFAYASGMPVLDDISFSAAAGETIAIVGPTGAGKTTLVNLIPRFFDPTSGRVCIDGVDLRDLRLADVRANVALVLQEPFLFPLSIRENIAFGRAGASQADIEAAARAANAHDFIERLPAKYDSVIGQRGSTLSGGERQRIAIARAILRNAPVLILDEPTSALDSETERDIMEALERLMAGRTTFIIAHRLSTIQRADRILVLERGTIVEAGTHDELSLRAGAYWRLRNPGKELAVGGS